MKVVSALVLGALALCAAPRAHAANVGGVEVHGFGGWATGYTGNGNRFGDTAADPVPFGSAYFSLNLSAAPTRTLSFNTQLFGVTALGEEGAEVDYAFLQWAPSSRFQLRAGKVKSPFGEYTEVYDVGTLRPFYLLPQALYVGPGLVSKSYMGGGATGNLALGGSWELSYDAVVGEMTFQDFEVEAPIGFDPVTRRPEFGALQLQPSSKWLAGARLHIATPVDGLAFGGSYMNFDLRTARDGGEAIANPETPRHDMLMAHVEYLTEAIWFRAEGFQVRGDGENGQKIDAAYAELAWRFAPAWQVGTSWERYDNATPSTVERAVDPATITHEAIGLALNYWPRRNVVLKLNYYHVDGVVYARPESVVGALQTGTFDSTTDAVVFGVQFSF
jgi:hypothetical protein